MKKENGFTLVETIIALFIAGFMMTAIYIAIITAQNSTSKIERRVVSQQDARGALDLMVMEIRMASYNPTLNNNIWNDTSCSGSGSGYQPYRGIQAATATSITIEMDTNGNGVINNDTINNPNEIIKYNYDSSANNQYITRSTNCTGGDQPFLGASSANSDTKTVRVVNNTTGLPVFRYFDGNNTEITSPVTSRIPDIRKIEITLVVDSYIADPGGNRQQLIYSTSVIPRNHILLR
jgi:prepilin-type N-terminal cleavage/methylation domain-containing protein